MFKDKSFSYLMHSQTESPGQLFPQEVQSYIRARYEFALKFIRNTDVLEIGCGSGYGIQCFLSYVKSYNGIELSVENIDRLRINYPEFSELIQNADAHHLPFNSSSYDSVVALAIIYYLDISKFLLECKRVLRKSGIIFFCT